MQEAFETHTKNSLILGGNQRKTKAIPELQLHRTRTKGVKLMNRFIRKRHLTSISPHQATAKRMRYPQGLL
jgi:hypothetical protein